MDLFKSLLVNLKWGKFKKKSNNVLKDKIN